jgi:hypothetical protein
MMKKLMAAAMVVAAFVLGSTNAEAQSTYKTGLGMRIDFGTGGTYVGPSAKHFFNANNAGEAHFLFGTGVSVLGLEYQYHGQIPNAEGLRWVAGLGPSIAFYSNQGGTHLWFRPLVGLDYKINNVPLNFGFDWRPIFTTQSNVTNRFEAARFGLAFRYAF